MTIENFKDLELVAQQELGLTLKVNLDSCIGTLERAKRGGGTKRVYGYIYKTKERMFEDLRNYVENSVKNKLFDEERKSAQKIKNDEIDANIKVGDVFVCSWGYEQTNINFYQVVSRKGKKTVTVREIARRVVEEFGGKYDYDYVVPAKDVFCGEEQDHRLNGGWIKFNSFMSASLVEDLNKPVMRSWGY